MVRVRPLHFLPVVLAVAFVPLACESPSDSGSPDTVGTVQPNGGVVTARDGQVRLEVPAGAVSEATEITADPMTDPPAHARLVPGTAFDFGPDGLVFDEAVTMELGYDRNAVPDGASEDRLRIHRWSGSEWRPIADGSADPDRAVATGTVTGFSTFAVLEDACAPAPMSAGASATGELTSDDCEIVVDGELRYQELFEVNASTTTAFDVEMVSSDVTPATGLTTRTADPADARMLAAHAPAEGDTARVQVLAAAGEYHVFAAGRDAGEGEYELRLASTSVTNSLGCTRGMHVAPPVSGVGQAISDEADCVVTIQYSPNPEVVGRETVEEYFWITAQAGATVEVTTTRTGGEEDFTPFPTLFLGGGEVVQTSGDPVAPSKTISHTMETAATLLLGVSSTLDEDLDYTQGSYSLSITVQ